MLRQRIVVQSLTFCMSFGIGSSCQVSREDRENEQNAQVDSELEEENEQNVQENRDRE